jgi:hypothetical protein
MARQALTIAGAVVGTMFGAPQLGFALGSLIGNAVDPVQIQGPKIGDLAVQTSRDGVPRPIVFGVAAVAGNIIDRSEPKIVKKKERQGKGGPVTVSERVYMSFAIRVCEGPATSISRIWENEKLVYDATSGSAIVADSNKFLQKVTFYLGDETQMPDPTLEAIHGVGNTPAHRGTCYAVFKDKDLTDFGGAIPQYRFEVNGPNFFNDSSFANVISLMHLDGNLTDQKGLIWEKNTSALTSYSAGGLFGNGVDAALYNAATYTFRTTSTVAVPIGGGNFTMEIWFKTPAVWPAALWNRCICAIGDECRIQLISRSVPSPRFQAFIVGASVTASGIALDVSTWYHLAVVRSGSTLYFFVNGELAGTDTTTYSIVTPNRLYIGQNGIADLFQPFGILDEFRLTAAARYTTAFTPPTQAFPNQ